MWEARVRSLGQEDPLEKEMAPPLLYSCLENPEDGEARVGYRPWTHKESDTTERLEFHFSLSRIGEGNGNPLVVLPGESQGRGSLVGCCLWGGTESDTTEAT